jgi:hypothetical protein
MAVNVRKKKARIKKQKPKSTRSFTVLEISDGKSKSSEPKGQVASYAYNYANATHKYPLIAIAGDKITVSHMHSSNIIVTMMQTVLKNISTGARVPFGEGTHHVSPGTYEHQVDSTIHFEGSPNGKYVLSVLWYTKA